LHFLRFASLLAITLAASSLYGQDTRTVAEPHIPAACVTLKASIAAPHGVIAPRDELKLDTKRIQHAIDACSAGKAIILRPRGLVPWRCMQE
jgi:polygalacturonase